MYRLLDCRNEEESGRGSGSWAGMGRHDGGSGLITDLEHARHLEPVRNLLAFGRMKWLSAMAWANGQKGGGHPSLLFLRKNGGEHLQEK